MTPHLHRRRVRLQDLVGARVRSLSGEVVGRIEEVRAERRDDDHEVVEYLLGTGALLERLALVHRLFGRQPVKLVVRWDQLDIADPACPRLTCAMDELHERH
jgi:hypothetical protein